MKLYLFINGDHKLGTDIQIWQKSTKAFSETQLCVEFTIEILCVL